MMLLMMITKGNNKVMHWSDAHLAGIVCAIYLYTLFLLAIIYSIWMTGLTSKFSTDRHRLARTLPFSLPAFITALLLLVHFRWKGVAKAQAGRQAGKISFVLLWMENQTVYSCNETNQAVQTTRATAESRKQSSIAALVQKVVNQKQPLFSIFCFINYDNN